MSQFALHGLSFQNEGSNFDQVFVALHALVMSEIENLFENIEKFALKLSLPFFSGNVNPDGLNRTVNIGLYHRTKIL